MPAYVIAHIASLPIAPDLTTEVIRLQKIYDRGIHTPFGSEHDRITKAFTSELQVIGNATIERALLRAIYDPAQLKEQMRWFWFNHFNVLLWDATVHAMIADYEGKAIRPHALGKFRDLLGATLRHPTMLRFRDNASNTATTGNENYARELHTMGVGSGYAQQDVQAGTNPDRSWLCLAGRSAQA